METLRSGPPDFEFIPSAVIGYIFNFDVTGRIERGMNYLSVEMIRVALRMIFFFFLPRIFYRAFVNSYQ